MGLTELPFSFVGKIYRSAMPFSAYDPGGDLFETYIDNEVSMIVLFASDQECIRATGRDLRKLYQDSGMQVYYLPISDFGVPQVSEVKDAIPEVLSHAQDGGNVVIHCHAGIGRTGMFAASLAKYGLGFTSEEAIHWVRKYIPGAVEVTRQEQLVKSV